MSDGPSCPLCSSRDSVDVDHAGNKRRLCNICDTIFSGSEREWASNREARETRARNLQRQAAALRPKAVPEPDAVSDDRWARRADLE